MRGNETEATGWEGNERNGNGKVGKGLEWNERKGKGMREGQGMRGKGRE